jgi:hypothetical protein
MGVLKRLGVETAFQTFNNYLSNIVRKRNASVVGPSRQITGEFPDVTFPRLYEYYHGWDQIKRSIDTMHQKFMGAGIEIRSNSDEFDVFVKKWMEIVNFQKKMSDFFLSVFITGNGILEKQFTDDGRIGNLSVIPMQTIYRIFRDEFGNEVKIVQNIDGIFKELDPEYYVHWMINNPDRQAFGKSEFHTLASPRKVSSKIDPDTGEPINPERNLVSLLDAQAELQNAEVEIKRLMAKPRVFASFPGMPQEQLGKLQAELSDEASDQTIWAFDKEAKMAEAQYSGQAKYQEYGKNVDSHIDIGTGFASQVISHPGGFSYSSSQTPFDVLDQRMVDMQSDGKEVIRDMILRPLAESWGIENFDEIECEIYFQPSVRRLTIEDIQRLPLDAVAPKEKREILKALHVPLDDSVFDAFTASGEQDEMMGGGGTTGQNIPQESPMSPSSPKQGAQQKPDSEKQRPKPAKEYYGTERIEVAPKTAGGDLFVPGGLNEDYDPPEITDTDILNQLLNRFDDESKWTINGDDSNTDEIINDMEDLDFGGIEDTAYPDHPSVGVPASIKGTDLNGIPYETSAPQKAKSSRYDEGQDTEATFGFLDNDNDKDRRRLIGEFINGKTRVVEKTTKK